MLKKTSATLSLLLLLAIAAAPLSRIRAQTPNTPPHAAAPATEPSDDLDVDTIPDPNFPDETADPDAQATTDDDTQVNPDGVGGTEPEPPGRHHHPIHHR